MTAKQRAGTSFRPNHGIVRTAARVRNILIAAAAHPQRYAPFASPKCGTGYGFKVNDMNGQSGHNTEARETKTDNGFNGETASIHSTPAHNHGIVQTAAR